ncbi:hypothetical protein KIL84_005202 [Mauremys mutica]|uniref:Uncharacterized protein n=1 Tax=Mauremys mutica TaxID=74926 RepID=A0A9D3XL11_9SAUR|nr:hypothetical protein KIL84_005202 [Mauremys mutica]
MGERGKGLGIPRFISQDKRTQSVSLQAFLPLLKKAEQKSTQTGLSCSKAAIINVSTIGGSIGNTPRLATFPVISYRCTKQQPGFASCDPEGNSKHRKVWASCHRGQEPTSLGWVLRTRVKFHSPPFMCTLQAELTVEDSVQGILKVLSTLSEKHHGIIVDWTERTVPW